jgi:hypothetical protein
MNSTTQTKTCKCGKEFTPRTRYNSTIKTNKCPSCFLADEMKGNPIPRKKVSEIAQKVAKRKKNNKPKYGKADRIFSLYTRQRDADENGIVRCISCGKPHYWREVDNGHFFGRENQALRFNEINCNGQCRHENRFKEGNKVGYRKGLVKKYSEKTVLELESHEHDTLQRSQYDIDEIEKYYTQLCIKLGYEIK